MTFANSESVETIELVSSRELEFSAWTATLPQSPMLEVRSRPVRRSQSHPLRRWEDQS